MSQQNHALLTIVLLIQFSLFFSFNCKNNYFNKLKPYTSNNLKLQLSDNIIEWSTKLVPNGYYEVVDDVSNEVKQFIFCNDTIQGLHSVDLLIPGLNPKLEQKAMLLQEILFELVVKISNVIELKYSNVVIMFTSVGDAASYMKFCRKNNFIVSDSIDVTGLNPNYPFNNDNLCILFIALKNNVGDPVIVDVQKIIENNPLSFSILINCDLTDKMNAGMKIKTQRDNFRSSIKPIYYFRNIVEISRPSLVPIEIGILSYKNNQWNIFIANPKDIKGSGSLNRYMIKENQVFKRNVNDPTEYNPPRFILVKSFTSQPKRDDIDMAMAKADYMITKADENIKLIKVPLVIKSIDQAIEIIDKYYRKREYSIQDVLKSIDFIQLNQIKNNKSNESKDNNINRLGMIDMSYDSPQVQTFDYNINQIQNNNNILNDIFQKSWIIHEKYEYNNNIYTSIEPTIMFSIETWNFIDKSKSINIDIFVGPIRLSNNIRNFFISENDNNEIKIIIKDTNNNEITYNLIYYSNEYFILEYNKNLILFKKK